jgi:pimeloyl-ACP methyl ester carboxylesterase
MALLHFIITGLFFYNELTHQKLCSIIDLYLLLYNHLPKRIIMSDETKTGFLPVKGAKLFYEVTGEGFPLVLVHSRWMLNALWDEQVKFFAAQFRVIRYDVRGFGKSEMELIPSSDVDDLLQLFDHLAVEQAYIVGLSMGAEIAISFALAHPERLKALVISGVGLDEFEWGESFNQQWQQFADAIKADDYNQAIDHVVSMWVDGPLRPAPQEVRDRTRELMRGHTFLHHKPFPPSSEAENTPPPQPEPVQPLSEKEKFAGLQVPTQVMVGEYDWPEMVKMAEILAGYLPNGEHILISGAAHITNLEQPEAFNRAVLNFLSRH